MLNFGFSYALPEGAPPLTHADKWDGKPESHEDGYLTGVQSVVRLMKRFEAEYAAANRTVIAYQVCTTRQLPLSPAISRHLPPSATPAPLTSCRMPSHLAVGGGAVGARQGHRICS